MIEVISLFRKILDYDRVLEGDDLRDKYTHIWKMDEALNAMVYLMPKHTEEVSSICKLCYEFDLPMVVFGGLTNLVGATETNGNEVVISMELMNGIEEIDVNARSMTVQSGVILENIQLAAKERDLLFPLNFGAKGSAQIGGAVSTNAGGLRVFRFGMTRNLILGLECVLPDGTIISSLKKIIKDNSGYDLKQLFIGSEGTLGIVTRLVLKLVEAPKSRCSAFVGINEFENVVGLLKFMESGLGGTLSAFELIWNKTYTDLTTPPAPSAPPLPQEYKYYVLLESLGSDYISDQKRLLDLLENAINDALILDACIAQSESDLNWFWTIREDIHPIVSRCQFDQHFDISLPTPLIGKIIDDITKEINQIEEVTQCYSFGHVADGNIHFVIGKTNDSLELREQINDIIYGPLKDIGGSVSAEHGIGVHKKKYLPISRTQEEIALMKLIKKSIDPKALLNPGKIL